METVYGLLGVDRGVPKVWGCVYDIRELLDSSVKLMDGKSPLEINLGHLNVFKKPILKAIKGTVIEKLLKDHDVIKSNMKYWKSKGRKSIHTFFPFRLQVQPNLKSRCICSTRYEGNFYIMIFFTLFTNVLYLAF